MIGATAREVDCARVERELVRLLNENRSASGQSATRSAVLNLVAYAADRSTMERIGHTLAALVDHHPSRTIVAFVNDKAAELDAWVEVRCKPMGTTGMNICAEQVVLEAPPSAARRLPNAVLPLLLADIPVVFWWPGEPPLRDPLLYDLLEPAYRFVVDSSEGGHLERYLTSLAQVRHRPGLDLDLVDLNWERITPWRELLAQFWDMSASRSLLRGIDRVEIDLARPPGGRSNRSQALLIAGWMTSRLGWTPRRIERLKDGYDLYARRGRGDVHFKIRIGSGPVHGVRGVRCFVETQSHASTFAVSAVGTDAAEIVVQRDGRPVVPARVARLETYEEAELLARALDTLRGETIYEDALDSVAAFLTLR